MGRILVFFGGRKFVFSVSIMTLITMLLLKGRIDGETFMQGVIWISGIFCGGNALEHLSVGGLAGVKGKKT